MPKTNGFDIMKTMSEADKKIYFMPLSQNLIRGQKVKAGTQLTIGTPLDCLAGIMRGEFVGGLIIADKTEWDETEKVLEEGEKIMRQIEGSQGEEV